jgi:hypothetical protein
MIPIKKEKASAAYYAAEACDLAVPLCLNKSTAGALRIRSPYGL